MSQCLARSDSPHTKDFVTLAETSKESKKKTKFYIYSSNVGMSASKTMILHDMCLKYELILGTNFYEENGILYFSYGVDKNQWIKVDCGISKDIYEKLKTQSYDSIDDFYSDVDQLELIYSYKQGYFVDSIGIIVKVEDIASMYEV